MIVIRSLNNPPTHIYWSFPSLRCFCVCSRCHISRSPLGHGACWKKKKKQTREDTHILFLHTFMFWLVRSQWQTDNVDLQVLARCSLDKCCSLSKGCSEPFVEECAATLTSPTCYFHPPLSQSLLDSLGGMWKKKKVFKSYVGNRKWAFDFNIKGWSFSCSHHRSAETTLQHKCTCFLLSAVSSH